jgi:hypothetical protein
MKRIPLLFLPCLAMAADYGTLSGTVVDDSTGEPLAGGVVVLYQQDSPTDYGSDVDATGRYEIINIPVGCYDVECSFMGYNTERATGILVTEEQSDTVDFRLSTKVLPSGADVEVLPKKVELVNIRDLLSERIIPDEEFRPDFIRPRSFDPPNRIRPCSLGCVAVHVVYGTCTPRTGLAGVMVALHDDTRVWQTGKGGVCYLDSVPVGEHVVMLHYPDTSLKLTEYDWPPAAPQARIAAVVAGDTVLVTATMYPAPPRYLTGVVLDSLTREPIEGATVRITGSGGWTGFGPFKGSSDSLGEFYVAVDSVSLSKPPMWFEYTVVHPGYVGFWETCPGGAFPRRCILLDTNRSAVVGRVTDSLTGQPLPGTYVFVSGSSYPYCNEFSTLADGTYELLHSPGACTVSVSPWGYHGARRSVEVAPDHPTRVDFRLTRDERCYGDDVDPDNGPAWSIAIMPARGAGSTDAKLRDLLGSAYTPWAGADIVDPDPIWKRFRAAGGSELHITVKTRGTGRAAERTQQVMELLRLHAGPEMTELVGDSVAKRWYGPYIHLSCNPKDSEPAELLRQALSGEFPRLGVSLSTWDYNIPARTVTVFVN